MSRFGCYCGVHWDCWGVGIQAFSTTDTFVSVVERIFGDDGVPARRRVAIAGGLGPFFGGVWMLL